MRGRAWRGGEYRSSAAWAGDVRVVGAALTTRNCGTTSYVSCWHQAALAGRIRGGPGFVCNHPHSGAVPMRAILGACCALAGWAGTAPALVTVDFLEKNSNAAVVYFPLSGGTYDITVRLYGHALQQPEPGRSFRRQQLSPCVCGRAAGRAVGPYGSEIIREDPSFALSTLGWVNVTLSPAAPGSRVTLQGVDAEVYDAGLELIPGTSVNAIEFVYVPEPAALVLVAARACALPRRRYSANHPCRRLARTRP